MSPDAPAIIGGVDGQHVDCLRLLDDGRKTAGSLGGLELTSPTSPLPTVNHSASTSSYNVMSVAS